MRPRRRPLAFAAAAPGEPISALNTTPLIDVMLVLLIMFIITVPAMTHSVKIDLPTNPRPVDVEPEVHRIDLDRAGGIRWDGAPVAEAALPARLAAFRAAAPDGVLHFHSDAETRYEDFDRVLASVKRAGVERLGVLGNDRYAEAFTD